MNLRHEMRLSNLVLVVMLNQEVPDTENLHYKTSTVKVKRLHNAETRNMS